MAELAIGISGHAFFQKLTTDVHACSAGGGDTEIGDLVVGVHLESINQAKFLNRTHRDGRQDTEVGHDGDDPAEAKAGTFYRGQFHAAADNGFGNVVQLLHIDGVDPTKRGDWQIVSGLKLEQEPLGIDSDCLVSTRQPAAECALRAPSQPRFLLGFGHLSRSLSGTRGSDTLVRLPTAPGTRRFLRNMQLSDKSVRSTQCRRYALC